MVEAFPFGGLFVHFAFKNLSYLGHLEITFPRKAPLFTSYFGTIIWGAKNIRKSLIIAK
jgi:hypothetical protein